MTHVLNIHLLPRENPKVSPRKLPDTLVHDLRQPLTAFGLLSDQLHEDLGNADTPPESTLKLLDLMSGTAHAEEKLLNSLSLYWRYSSAPSSFPTTPICFSDIAEAIQNKFREHHPEINLKVTGFNKKLWARSNLEHLAIALNCLLDNAVHHANSTIEISAHQSLNTVRIDVTDDGPGLPEDILEELGMPFIRSKMLSNSRANGLGLGLGLGIYIATSIASSLGHPLFLSLGSSKGCRFSFSLEKSDPSKQVLEEKRSAPLLFSGLRVSIVDPRRENEQAIDLLKRLGCNVKSIDINFSSMQTIFASINPGNPDVLFVPLEYWRVLAKQLNARPIRQLNVLILVEDSTQDVLDINEVPGIQIRLLRHPLSPSRLSAALALFQSDSAKGSANSRRQP
jgi:anti-sigma regulatory factor (Ser/Thr protein kinase)